MVSHLVQNSVGKERGKVQRCTKFGYVLDHSSNELRLGRQQISSLEEGMFGIRLLTSPVDPPVEVGRWRGEQKNEMMEDRGERTQVTDA